MHIYISKYVYLSKITYTYLSINHAFMYLYVKIISLNIDEKLVRIFICLQSFSYIILHFQ